MFFHFGLEPRIIDFPFRVDIPQRISNILLLFGEALSDFVLHAAILEDGIFDGDQSIAYKFARLFSLGHDAFIDFAQFLIIEASG